MAVIDERDLDSPRCITCGYSLVQLPRDRCPECGRRFDPSNYRTFTTQRSQKYTKRRLIWSLWIVAPAFAEIVLSVSIRGADIFCVSAGLATPYLLGALLGQNGDRRIYLLCWIAGVIGFGLAAYFLFVSRILDFGSDSVPTDGYVNDVLGYVSAFVACSFAAGAIIGWISRNQLSKLRHE